MKELRKNKKLWIIFSAEILLIFLGVWFIFLPLIKNIIDKADKIQKIKIDQNFLADRVSKIEKAHQEHDKLTEGVDKLDVILKSEEEVDFFKELEKIAESTSNAINIKIIEEDKNNSKSSIAVDKEAKEILDTLSYKNYFLLQINLKGEYAGLVNFLHKLENLNHYLLVVSVNAQKVKETPTGELVPVNAMNTLPSVPEEVEKLNSLITVAVYSK